jgi:hypothetical protein
LSFQSAPWPMQAAAIRLLPASFFSSKHMWSL